nr:MAG TPA: hypothetical protein [Caudoviricetes sp.]
MGEGRTDSGDASITSSEGTERPSLQLETPRAPRMTHKA